MVASFFTNAKIARGCFVQSRAIAAYIVPVGRRLARRSKLRDLAKKRNKEATRGNSFRYLCDMKWFCRLLSIYLMTLACLPCSDGGHAHDDHEGESISLMEDSSQDTEHRDCNDFCTPFCQCTCCGLTVLNSKQAASTSKALYAPDVRTNDFYYQAPFSSAHPSALFRPPINKLG